MWLAYKGEGGGKLNASAKRDESVKRDRWALVRNACPDAIVFFVFLRPPDGRKNPDWSELMNEENNSVRAGVPYERPMIALRARIQLPPSFPFVRRPRRLASI